MSQIWNEDREDVVQNSPRQIIVEILRAYSIVGWYRRWLSVTQYRQYRDKDLWLVRLGK